MNARTMLFVCCLTFATTFSTRADELPALEGRIALSHDGNNYDKDDYLAAAMNLALLHATGLKDKLVHCEHSCHLVNRKKQYREMLDSVNGAVERFDIDASRVFDCQTQLDEAIANFKCEAEKSTAEDPLWYCLGGPMEIPWRCINAVDPTKREFIYCVSHSSPFNETHVSPPTMTHNWEDIAALGATIVQIKNQNQTEWNTKPANVSWMKKSSNPDLRWLFRRNAKSKFDSSDSGMLWWVITGGKDGGNEDAGWKEYQSVLESIKHSAAPGSAGKPSDGPSQYVEQQGVVVIEAENTLSDLGQWELKRNALQSPYCGQGYLEFTGNNPRSGPANSPLSYSFAISNGGLYSIHLRCARETIDGRKDVANDCYLRLEGDFGPGPKPGDQHGDDAPLKMLRRNTKFYGGDDRKFVWASGKRLDPGGHNNKRGAVYHLKAGETYTLVVSGRSQKYKLDRILFRHDSLAPKLVEQLQVPESKRIPIKE